MQRPGSDFPGVGVGMVIQRDDRILLYRRMRPPEAGYWNIVGGKVDLMEAARDAAIREAMEETGLVIEDADFLGVTEQIMTADRQHWVSLLYVATRFSGDARLTEPDKLSDFGWFAPDVLPEPLSAFTRAALALLR
ncbi:NUDIX domain-containing protein [Rhizobium sp. RU20A]|uniref:NUDIX domain-containing protein n=1 Tax=Rhizobium sp. RU20A TaxID=1907412 RepID=UPI00122CEBA0|nr:NUDIX domain-containing protein [Rhizobium sp. RU20A]